MIESPSQIDASRRQFMKKTSAAVTAAAVTGLSASAASTQDRTDDRKTNLLFVLCDQWRASAVSWLDDNVRTPNLEGMADDGVVFKNAFAANPVCTPNRSCILTGRHSHQHGMIANSLMMPPSERCWPEVFRDAGYATHYVGKWHMDGAAKPGYVPPGWRRRGFQSFEGFNRGHVYHRHWGFDDEGGPLPFEKGGDPYYEPTLQAEMAMDFIRQTQSKNPWACFLSWGPPHTPFNPPDAFDKYDPAKIKLPANIPPAHSARARRELAGYYGLCESLDHELGRILKCLDDVGAAENTLVVFTADHGELAGSHGKYRKGEPENESLQVPLVIRQKGKLRGGRTSGVLYNSIDHFRTILSLCGLPDSGTATGIDLSGFVTGEKPERDGPQSIYCEGKVNGSPLKDEDRKLDGKRKQQTADTATAWRTIITRDRKLTVRGNWSNPEHLFDSKTDPMELRNLVKEEDYQQELKRLLEDMKAHAKKTGDSFPFRPKMAKASYTDEEAEEAGV